MLNLDRLLALRAVATQGSINAAAEALHVTTSAVSQQLAKLEREVGPALLERNGWIASNRSADGRERPLRLTPAGQAKLEEAFPAWQEAQAIAGRNLAAA